MTGNFMVYSILIYCIITFIASTLICFKKKNIETFFMSIFSGVLLINILLMIFGAHSETSQGNGNFIQKITYLLPIHVHSFLTNISLIFLSIAFLIYAIRIIRNPNEGVSANLDTADAESK